MSRWTTWQRLLCFLVLAIVAVFGYLVLFSLLSHGAESQTSPAAALAPLLLMCGLYVLNVNFLRAEGWSMAAIGLNQPARRGRQFAIGFGAGSVLVVCWAVIVTVFLHPHWQIAHRFDLKSSVWLVSFTLFLGASEELAYRAYALLRIGESYGTLVGIVGTSALFTLLHIQGGVPWLNALAGVFTCALIYASIFERWRSVPLVLGFHVANNVSQNLLGLRVSPLTLVEPTDIHPSAGSITLLAVALLNLAIALYIWKGIPHRGKLHILP